MASAMNSENSAKKIYLTVIDEVLTNVREAFLDEGYDEQLLQELKHMWENKLNASRALNVPSNIDSDVSSKSAHHNSASNPSVLRLPVSNAPASTLSHSVASMYSPSPMSHLQQHSNPPSIINLDVKPQSIDYATRTALQALPQSLYAPAGSKKPTSMSANQLDGAAIDEALIGGIGSSDEDDDDDDIVVGDDDDDLPDDNVTSDEHGEYLGKEDPDPLNSDDDLTGPDSNSSNSELFDTEQVIVCQYDKITRIKNRWKFHLKDGVMNINGKDYLFSKANGDAEW